MCVFFAKVPLPVQAEVHQNHRRGDYLRPGVVPSWPRHRAGAGGPRPHRRPVLRQRVQRFQFAVRRSGCL